MTDTNSNTEPLSVKKRRTQITHRESINLSDMEQRMKKMGYSVRIKQGGSLCVEHPSFMGNASITITRKNAFIENAELQSPKAIRVYDVMKKQVESAMLDSLDAIGKKREALIKSPRLNDLSVRELVTDMIVQYENQKDRPMDEKEKEASQIEFFDKDGNTYLSINQEYDKDGSPVIEVQYGKEYGSFSKTFAVTEADIDDLKTDNLYRSQTIKDIENFVSMGDKKYKRLSEKDNINTKPEFTASYEVYKNSKTELVFDSTYIEPFTYDREWINKLAKIEDSILDMKVRYINPTVDMAKDIMKILQEAASGIAHPYKDGALSGMEMFTGLRDFKNGLDLGNTLYKMEREYQTFKKEGNQISDLQALNKKFEIKYYRDQVVEKANVYARAAVSLKMKMNELSDTISDLKVRAEANIERKCDATKSFLVKNVSQRVADLNRDIIDLTHKMETSFHDMVKSAFELSVERGNKLKEDISLKGNQFKEKYNQTVQMTRNTLSIQAYSIEKIAQIMNDSTIEAEFEKEYMKHMRETNSHRLWKELDHRISLGEAVKDVIKINNISNPRPEEQKIIEDGERAKATRDEQLYIAKRIRDDLLDIVKDNDITKTEAVEKIITTCERAGYEFRTPKESEVEYPEFGPSDFFGEEIWDNERYAIGKLLESMPNVNDHLEKNEQRQKNSHSRDDRNEQKRNNNSRRDDR